MPVTNLQIIPDEVDDTDGTFYFHYTWTPVTQDVNGAPLVVDQYDLYWSYRPVRPVPGRLELLQLLPDQPHPEHPARGRITDRHPLRGGGHGRVPGCR
jgi:hypothetical protein